MKIIQVFLASVLSTLGSLMAADRDTQPPRLRCVMLDKAAKRSLYCAAWIFPCTAFDTKAKQGVQLEVEYDSRTYLLGEPMWVRCSLANYLESDIFVAYPDGSRGATVLQVVTADGSRVPQRPYLGQGNGRGTAIPAGARLVEVFNVPDQYGISRPGDYTIVARYACDGTLSKYDAKKREIVTEQIWQGELESKVGTARILQPIREVDKAGLRILAKKSATTLRTGPESGFPFERAFHDAGKCRELIEQCQGSVYTEYARYFEALRALDRFEDTRNPQLARPALALLDAIDSQDRQQLFGELIYYHRIQGRLAIGTDKEELGALSRDFLSKYPRSPLASEVREVTQESRD